MGSTGEKFVELHTVINQESAIAILNGKHRFIASPMEDFTEFFTDRSLVTRQGLMLSRTHKDERLAILSVSALKAELEPYKPADWEINGPVDSYWVHEEDFHKFSALIVGEVAVTFI